MTKLRIIDLDIEEALSADTKVEAVALVEHPAIETEFMYFAEESFVVTDEIASKACKARKYKEENGSSCGTPVGWTRSAQLCNKENISLDTVKRMYSYLSRHKVDLETSKSYDDGCGLLMYDCWGGEPALEWSKKIVEKFEDFDYDITALPDYVNYDTGTTMIEDVAFVQKNPGETKDEYIGRCIAYHIDKGYPQDQAAAICYNQAEEAFNCGCFEEDPCWPDYEMVGQKEVDGKMVPNCVPVNMESTFSHYDLEDYELLKVLKELKQTSEQDFAAVTNLLYQGLTLQQVMEAQFRNGQKLYRYDRVTTPESNDHRDFCLSIEGNYFRRSIIDALSDFNTEFGHNRQPYSKWLYKGGPNCIHGWREFIWNSTWDDNGNRNVTLIDNGIVPGLPGTAPLNMPNNGYYSAKTKRKSEVAYIISQQQREGFTKATLESMIVDIDGTLIDGIDPRRPVINYVNSHYGKHRVIIVTGRTKDREQETIRELARFGVRYDDIYFNPGGSVANHKYQVAQNLLNKNYVITEAIENNPYDGAQYARLGIKVRKPESLSEQFSRLMFRSDDEKRMLYSPLMVPGLLIPRIDDVTGDQFFVRFTKEAIERMQNKFMIEQRLRNTNLEHDNSDAFEDMVMVESWIVQGKNDKAFELGFGENEIPTGTWMVGYKILDTPEGDIIWNDYIKTGKVKGLSAEGAFLMNFNGQNKSDEYLLKRIINILNQIEK